MKETKTPNPAVTGATLFLFAVHPSASAIATASKKAGCYCCFDKCDADLKVFRRHYHGSAKFVTPP